MIRCIENIYTDFGSLDDFKEKREKVLILGLKNEGLEFPIDEYLGYLNAFIYYRREKNCIIDFSIVGLPGDCILRLDDLKEYLEHNTRNGKVKLVTFSYTIYKAFLYGYELLKNEFKDKIEFEYIGIPITSSLELVIPSRVYFIFSNKEYSEYKYEFFKEVFNIYRCNGYSTDKLKSLPYKNDYERSLLIEDEEFINTYKEKGTSPELFRTMLDRFLKPVKYRKEEEERL